MIPKKKVLQFLKLLSETGNISDSCNKSGMKRQTVYDMIHRDPKFKELIDDTRYLGVEALLDEARRRAYQGVEEPVFYRGKVCGNITKYSDSLLMFLIKAARPEYRDNFKKVDLSVENDSFHLTMNFSDSSEE